jgi:hypothetical protein
MRHEKCRSDKWRRIEEKWLRMTEKSHLIDKKRLWTMAIEGAAVMRKMGC